MNGAQRGVAPSERTRVRRLAELARYDRESIDAILDAGLVAHVGTVADGDRPIVVPMAYGRDGDRLLLHGSVASATARRATAGVPVCVTVTLLEGLIVARSLFESSMRYRSVVVVGSASVITDPAEKLEALVTLSERLMPGRSTEVRPTTPKELAATTVWTIPLEEATAKVSDGFSQDPAPDRELPIWAGVVGIRQVFDDPIPVPGLSAGIDVPPSVRSWRAARSDP